VKLKAKVVFITDADHHTGNALIRRMAEEGANFIINSESGGLEIQT
jgi:NAD(P)-dependent dehydrogenase (short-subunit alcohol dehydrogenase family)